MNVSRIPWIYLPSFSCNASFSSSGESFGSAGKAGWCALGAKGATVANIAYDSRFFSEERRPCHDMIMCSAGKEVYIAQQRDVQNIKARDEGMKTSRDGGEHCGWLRGGLLGIGPYMRR